MRNAEDKMKPSWLLQFRSTMNYVQDFASIVAFYLDAERLLYRYTEELEIAWLNNSFFYVVMIYYGCKTYTTSPNLSTQTVFRHEIAYVHDAVRNVPFFRCSQNHFLQFHRYLSNFPCFIRISSSKSITCSAIITLHRFFLAIQ